MDIILNVTKKESNHMAGLLKLICSLKCRCKVNTEEGIVSIVGMPDSYIEPVIDAVDAVFEIITADIVPTEESSNPVFLQEKPVVFEEQFPSIENETSKEVEEVDNEENTGNLNMASEEKNAEKEEKKTSLKSERKITLEEYLESLLKDSLEKIDSSKDKEEQIGEFLKNIGFQKEQDVICQDVIHQAFLSACSIDKITISNIAIKISNNLTSLKES